MATWYLLNTTRFKGPNGPVLKTAGSLIDDQKFNLPALEAAGGKVAPSSDATVATAAALANKRKRQGAPYQILDTIMLASVTAEAPNRGTSAGAAGGTVVAAAAIVPAVTITPQSSGTVRVRGWASFQGAAAGTIRPLIQQGGVTIAAPAGYTGAAGSFPYDPQAEVEITGLAIGVAVTFSFVTTAGDITATLGSGATGIAAALFVEERP